MILRGRSKNPRRPSQLPPRRQRGGSNLPFIFAGHAFDHRRTLRSGAAKYYLRRREISLSADARRSRGA
jgi:hypothetical protein